MMRGLGQQMMEPEFLRRDMPLFVQTLDLDESQRPILETLLMDYSDAFTEAAESMREQFAGLRPRTPEQEARSQQRREIGQQMREAVQQLRELRQSTPEGEEPDPAKTDDIRQQMENLQKQMVELRPPRPEGEELKQLRDAMTEMGDQWRATRKAIRDEFVADVQTILIEEQLAKWPRLERLLRREKTLRQSQLSAEGIDLFHLVRDMRLTADEASQVEAALQQYDLALDAALIARNNRMDAIRGEMMGAMMERNVEQAQSLAEEEARLRTAVRTVNEQYVELISAALGGDEAEQVRVMFAERAYPRIVRPTYAQRSLEAALELEGLSPETLVAVQSLNEQYAAASKAANAELIAMVRDSEPQRITQRMQFWAARANGQEAPQQEGDDLREKFERRFEVNQQYRTRLESLLTPEQIAQLPATPPARGEGGPGRDWREGRRGPRDGQASPDDPQRQQMRERMRQNPSVAPPI
jgi:hypothetical protein